MSGSYKNEAFERVNENRYDGIKSLDEQEKATEINKVHLCLSCLPWPSQPGRKKKTNKMKMSECEMLTSGRRKHNCLLATNRPSNRPALRSFLFYPPLDSHRNPKRT